MSKMCMSDVWKLWLLNIGLSYWAREYCIHVDDSPEVRKLINSSVDAYRYFEHYGEKIKKIDNGYKLRRMVRDYLIITS